MKLDITTKADIELFINTFYDKVRKDHLLGPVFTNITPVNWIKFLPKMYRFWESTLLFDFKAYSRKPTDMHLELNSKIPIEQAHYNRWLTIWNETIDTLFEGPIAAKAKRCGKSIAELMAHKIERYAS